MIKINIFIFIVILFGALNVKGNDMYVWSQLENVLGETLGVAGVQVSLNSEGMPFVMTKEYENSEYLSNKRGVVSEMNYKDNGWLVVGKKGVTTGATALHP